MNQPLAYKSIEFDPVADPDAVVVHGAARFTLLTSRLVRLEYAPDGRFEDRPSQPFWYRRQPVPRFEVKQSSAGLVLATDHLELRYQATGDAFSPESLAITLLGSGDEWHYGDQDALNLLGTTRTLDDVSGSTRLEEGLLSRSGWSVVDDSQTLIFNDAGWLASRQAAPGAKDLYFFGYGQDYRACLRDYARVAGRTPMLPRWVLGNWWSRYWAYSAAELQELMAEFRAHEVPLSVCIVDMDWHLVDVGPGISGWTGYTWNKELFPDPPAFIAWLHEQGLRTALNLHPALGIRPHEEAYPEMARRLGVDPQSRQTVAFDIADPEFAQAYFEVLHHPQEVNGVDFWWMDWQQGEESRLAGLDPLWWLNHLHYYDLGRNGKRPFVFSRWGGLGNHRYPIGFSGDTLVTWESLAFQPYFTATAANVGYGWWSHDIGGHMQGVEDGELFTRWVQFGVFSPIFRLHSTKNPYHERRPWGYNAEVFRITREMMQLRHALIPYLYTLSWLNESQDLAAVRPLYHDYPDQEAAYACPQAYLFGQLLVAPFTAPADADTRLSRQVVWLPPGEWYHFFTGQFYAGDAWYALHGKLDEIPVFAPAGAIVPLAPRVGWGGVAVPDTLDVTCFAGADGRFELFEDDSESLAYQTGGHALTTVEMRWGTEVTIDVHPALGDVRHTPERRRLRMRIVGVSAEVDVTISVGNESTPWPATYDAARETLDLAPIEMSREAPLRITLGVQANGTTLARRDRTVENARQLIRSFRLETQAKMALGDMLAELVGTPGLLGLLDLETSPSQVRALLETLLEAGAHHVANMAHPDQLVLWNNRHDPRITYRYRVVDRETMDASERFQVEAGDAPRFRSLIPVTDSWRLTVAYEGLYSFDLDPRR